MYNIFFGKIRFAGDAQSLRTDGQLPFAIAARVFQR